MPTDRQTEPWCFPVMNRLIPGCPSCIPWPLIKPHEKQAHKNHMQTLKRLAERGGLSPGELVAVLEDREWRRMDDAEAVRIIGDAVATFQREADH